MFISGKQSQRGKSSGCSRTTVFMITTGLAIAIFSGIKLSNLESGMKSHKAAGASERFSIFKKGTKVFLDNFAEFGSRISATDVITTRGVQSKFNVEFNKYWGSIDIDAPFHYLLDGKNAHRYYFEMAHPEHCYTNFTMKGRVKGKEKTIETGWLHFSCEALMKFTFGKVQPSVLGGKVPLYFVEGKNEVYANTFLHYLIIGKKKDKNAIIEKEKEKKKSIISKISQVRGDSDSGDWDFSKMKKIDTKAIVTQGEGDYQVKLGLLAVIQNGKYVVKK